MGWLSPKTPDSPKPEGAGADPVSTADHRSTRRHGRFRRYVLRTAGWTLAALALGVLLLQWWLDTDPARERARRLLEVELSEHLDRQVSLESVRFQLLPLQMELWNLEIDGGPETDAPFLQLPYTYIEADLWALQNRRIHLQLLRLERPHIDLRFYPGGGDNIARGAGDTRGADATDTSYELLIDQVEIERAALDLDNQAGHFTVDAYHLRSRLRGLGNHTLAGRLSASEVVVTLPQAEAVRVAVVAEGELDADGLRVDNGRIVNRRLDLDVTGDCDWGQDAPRDHHCTFQTRGHGTGAALDQLGYFSGLSGRFELDGVFAWRSDAIGWRGAVEADALRLWRRHRLTGLRAQLAVDRFRADLDVARAGYSGGSLKGSVNADLTAEGYPITADLVAHDLHLDTLLANQGLPVHGLSARVDGNLLYTCTVNRGLWGSGRAEVALRADSPDAPGLPVQGAFPLRLLDGWIFADAVNVTAQDQSLLAVGAYHLDLERGRFDYEVATADVAELVPLLPGGDLPKDYWPLTGNGRVSGVLQVESGAAYTRVNLDLEQVRTRKGEADRVTGGLYLTPWALEDLSLDLRHDLGSSEGALTIRGRLPWTSEAGNGRLMFDADSWPMEKIRPWLDFDLPLAGAVDGRLDLALTDDGTTGDLSASMDDAQLLDVPPAPGSSEPFKVDRLLADLSWDESRLDVGRVTALAPAGRIHAEGTTRWADGRLDFRLGSEALNLGDPPLRAYLPRPDLQTQAKLEAHLSGTLDSPSLNVSLDAERLMVGDRELMGLPSRLEASWTDGRLLIAGNLLDGAELKGGGVLDLPRVDLEMEVVAKDLARVAQVVADHDLGGSLAGRLTLRRERPPDDQARPSSPAPLALRLRLHQLDVTVNDHRLLAEPPIDLRFGVDHWNIERLRLEEPVTRSFLHLAGRLGYENTSPVDLMTEADLQTSWLEVVLPDLGLDGRVTVSGRVTGSLERPWLEGSGTLADASLPIAGVGDGFQNINGGLRFQGNRLALEGLQADLAGGSTTVSGDVSWAQPGALDSSGLEYRLDLTGQGIELPDLEGWSLRGDVVLALSSQNEGHLLSGRADLRQLDYLQDIRFDVAEILRELLRGRQLEVETADNVLAAVQLQVEIQAPNAVKLSNNLAQLEGSADLQLRGNLAQPVLFGELVMNPGGLVVYNSSDYRLRRGRLVFSDPYRLEPEVDLVAATQIRDFDVTLALSGPLDQLEARFSSEPPLPEVEVFRLLAGGDTYVDQTELLPDRTAKLYEEDENSAATFLYGQAASAIGDRVNSLFGFDKFRIDPLTGSGDNFSKAQLTVGKRLSKDFFVTYSVDPSDSENQKIQVEWQLTDSLVLVLTQNGDNSFSADARWESTF